MIKIAIVGSHGVGKTTLSSKISEHYKFPVIPDVVREAFEKKFTINEQTPPETQFWILSKQIELERNTPLPWISDKTLYDNFIYGKVLLRHEKAKEVIYDIVMEQAKYDVIFYLPVEFAIADDGLRSLNAEFQQAIDRAYLEFLQKHGIEYYVIRGTVEERLRQAVDVIEKFL